ncbi:MAG: hypothetical protein ACTHK0_01165 [Ginsengibacter sp.]
MQERIEQHAQKRRALLHQLTRNGKVYYLKQEVAATLKKNIVVGKNSPLRKNGLKCISTLMGMFSICPFDGAELVNMLMFA